jgi:hypothetical protein
MTSILIEKELAYPVETVWAILGDFGNLGWVEGPERIEIIGEGVGMTRRVHMTGMDPIDEILESIDEANLSFSYSIPNMPMPVTDYLSSVKLEDKGDGTTRVHWACTCTPTDANMAEADVEAMLNGTYQQLLSWLDAHLASQ